MLDIITNIVAGFALGAVLTGIVYYFNRKGKISSFDESSLQIAYDRLERAEQDKNKLIEDLSLQTKLKDDLNAQNSSLKTLVEETNKQFESISKEYSSLRDQLTKQSENFQEVSRKLAASEIKTDSLIQQLSETGKELSEIKVERRTLQENLGSAKERAVELEKENKYLKEMLEKQKTEIEEIGKKFSNEFKLLADSILEDKSKRFTEINQNNIERLLKPLGENIQQFQKKVDEVYDRESKERFSLGKEVEKLVLLNQKISEEASNLTNALKGQVKQQGNWGEMILESILERSGLVKDREYFVQESIKDEDGRRFQPDVIIKYPDERKVIIDSKVSLVAYERYCSGQDADEQKKELASHIRSIRNHIDLLSSKGYQELVGDLDFVTMFLPVEPAFILAMQADPDIWNYAYSRGVLLLSPTNLIAALKLIHNLWQREYQNRHALEIADRGGKLYDKFVSLIESLNSVGDSLSKSQTSFDNAMKQLHTGTGNLVSQAQKLKDLGAKAKKSLPTGLLDQLDDEQPQLPENE